MRRRFNNDHYTISDLTYEFEEACEKYKETLRSRESNRSKKELSRGNTRGTNVHKFQCSFAWIIHEMTVGHYSQNKKYVEEAKSLIAHIISISE